MSTIDQTMLHRFHHFSYAESRRAALKTDLFQTGAKACRVCLKAGRGDVKRLEWSWEGAEFHLLWYVLQLKSFPLITALSSGVVPRRAKLKQQIVGKSPAISSVLLRPTEESNKPSGKPSAYLNLAAAWKNAELIRDQPERQVFIHRLDRCPCNCSSLPAVLVPFASWCLRRLSFNCYQWSFQRFIIYILDVC